MDLNLPAGAPPDLFITEALDARPRGKPDYAREARAIQALAVSMADIPETVLPQFVDLALRLTGAVSGGLSLWEREPAPGVFRWCFLRGTLSPFNGATTPRNHSPCGVTLDRDAPQLALWPARAYAWIEEAGVEAPEVLLVPLHLNDGQPFGTLWVVADAEGRFTRDHATLLTDLAKCVAVSAAQWERRRLGALAH
jgi:hypothetical protein